MCIVKVSLGGLWLLSVAIVLYAPPGYRFGITIGHPPGLGYRDIVVHGNVFCKVDKQGNLR